MGLFSRNKPTTPAVDPSQWRSAYIRMYGPVPSISNVLHEIPGELGVGPESIDQQKALILLYGLFNGVVSATSEKLGDTTIGDELSHVVESRGFDDEALWDIIFARGANGTALANHINEEYIVTGWFAHAIAEQLRESGGVRSFVQLTDPHLDLSDPKQVFYSTMTDLGLYWVLYGDGDPQQLGAALAEVAPEILIPATSTIGGGDSVVRWLMYSTEGKTAIVVVPMLDANDDIQPLVNLQDRLESLSPSWKVQAGKQGAFVPEESAEVLSSGEVVDLDTVDALAPEPLRSQRSSIRNALVAAGAQQINTGLYKGVFSGMEGRTQLVWFIFGSQLDVVSPVREGVSDTLPTDLEALDTGKYVLDAFPPFAVLRSSVDYAEGFESIVEQAAELATFADSVEAQFEETGVETDLL